MAKQKIIVDLKNCIGCTLCTQIAPNVFEMRNDGKSHVKKTASGDDSRTKQAVESCPVDAIKIS